MEKLSQWPTFIKHQVSQEIYLQIISEINARSETPKGILPKVFLSNHYSLVDVPVYMYLSNTKTINQYTFIQG